MMQLHQDHCQVYYSPDTIVTSPPTGCNCSAPNCSANLITNPNAPTFSLCEDLGYFAEDTVITNYYTIQSSSDGTLGILQQLLSDAGTFVGNFNTLSGCDSIVTLTLNVNPVQEYELFETIFTFINWPNN